jgi:hypothetical protein
MGPGSSPAMRALRRAQAAARYARRTGCDIGEATSVLAEHAAGPARGGQPGGARPAMGCPGGRSWGVDDLGRFRAESVPAGPVSLYCRLGPGGPGAAVVTDWVSL